VHVQILQDVQEHLRMRLGERFVHGAGGMEETGEPGLAEHVLQAAPALAGRHRQQVALAGQIVQHLPDALEQHRPVAPGGDPVFPVALQDAVEHGVAAARAEDVHGLPQAEADRAADRLLRQRVEAQLLHHGLRTSGDRADGIHQRTVPIEHEKAGRRHQKSHDDRGAQTWFNPARHCCRRG
jgi:hypothetical protein